MAEISTVARPYTKAAFETALEQGALDQWSEMLALASAVTEHEQVVKLLNSPALSSAQKADLILGVCSDKMSEHARNFVNVLAENKRLSLLPEIFALFEKLKAAQQKSLNIEVTSAYKLSKEQQEKLAQALTKRFSRDVSISASVDKALIGGLTIRAGDMVIDGSVRGKLGKLAEVLNV